MADHKHGSMNVASQQQTFGGFVRWIIGVAVFSIAVLIFLSIFNS